MERSLKSGDIEKRGPTKGLALKCQSPAQLLQCFFLALALLFPLALPLLLGLAFARVLLLLLFFLPAALLFGFVAVFRFAVVWGAMVALPPGPPVPGGSTMMIPSPGFPPVVRDAAPDAAAGEAVTVCGAQV